MKKLLTISFLALASFALPSCGEDDDNARTQDPTPTPATIEGVWKNYYSSTTVYDANNSQVGNPITTTTSGSDRITLTFNPPSTHIEQTKTTTRTGSYVKNNSQLTITFSPTTVGTYHIDSLTATRMVLSTITNNGSGGKNITIFKSVR